MAAAGTLSRPSSAQGSYGPFQTYYAPPSPTISSPSYVRPTSAASNYVSDNYSTYRKPVSNRPTTPRHSTSTHHIPSITPSSPTRIYGHRNLSKSSEDIQRFEQQPPLVQPLQRNYTAPDLRHVSSPKRSLASSSSRTFRGHLDEVDHVPTNPHDTGTLDNTTRHFSHPKLRDHSRNLSSPAIVDTEPHLEVVQELAASTNAIMIDQMNGSDFDRYNLPRPKFMDGQADVQSTTKITDREESGKDQPTFNDSEPIQVKSRDIPSQNQAGKPFTNLQEEASSILGTSKLSPSTTNQSETNTILRDAYHAEDEIQLKTSTSEVDMAHERKQHPSIIDQMPPRSNTPVPSNYTTQEKSKSLKDRLRRALSFSSRNELVSMTPSDTTIGRKPKDNRGLFAQNNKSTDNISISSTASSASLLLRKMGHGFSKKTKRSINGIFSGSRTKSNTDIERPVVGNISYINAEARSEHHSDLGSMSNTTAQSPAQQSISSLGVRTDPVVRTEITEAVSNVDGHGSIAFPRLSEEIVVEEDRNRRASMHLERPLPIDLAVHRSLASPMSGSRSVSMPVSSSNMSVSTYRGKGILKKTLDPLQGESSLLTTHDALPPANYPPGADTFDISFAPTPTLDLNGFATPTQAHSRRTSIGNSVQASPSAYAGSSPQSLTFCPRITIHETYTAMEYDRRGDIATCNRLTPLLAQRIKEELNAYKMDEMDVANESRVHTHFFT